MELWYPLAERVPGPAEKVGYEPPLGRVSQKKIGEIDHSMVGSYQSALTVLMDVSKNPDGSYKKPASWTFSILKTGEVKQHYSVVTNTWHGNDIDMDGDVAANIDLIGVEYEGGGVGNFNEPLTEPQFQSGVDLSRWLGLQFTKLSFGYYEGNTDDPYIWYQAEHNQVGDTPTACPSGRIPWARKLAALNFTSVPVPSMEDYVMNPTWATWAQRPANIPYRSYLLFGTPDGLKKLWVKSIEEHNAIAASSITDQTQPQGMDLAVLKSFQGGPEPDDRTFNETEPTTSSGTGAVITESVSPRSARRTSTSIESASDVTTGDDPNAGKENEANAPEARK